MDGDHETTKNVTLIVGGGGGKQILDATIRHETTQLNTLFFVSCYLFVCVHNKHFYSLPVPPAVPDCLIVVWPVASEELKVELKAQGVPLQCWHAIRSLFLVEVTDVHVGRLCSSPIQLRRQ